MADCNLSEEDESSNSEEELPQNKTRKRKRSENQASIKDDSSSSSEDDNDKLKEKRKNLTDYVNLSNKRKSSDDAVEDEKYNLAYYKAKKLKPKLLRILEDGDLDSDVDENREEVEFEVEHHGERSDIDDFIVNGRPKTDKGKKMYPSFTYSDISSSELLSKSKSDVNGSSELDRNIKILENDHDIPERMQLREVPVTQVTQNSNEFDEEAKWIYEQAFCKPTISSQNGFLSKEEKEKLQKGLKTIPKIRQTLIYLRNQHLEVPFIAFYRKEFIQPELTINDLWRIYKFDEKWCSFKQQKDHILSLFQEIRTQQEQTSEITTKENLHTIEDFDIEYLKNVQTMVELQDVRNHFFLYHKKELKDIQEKKRERKRIENQEEKGEHFKPVNRCDSYTLYKKAGLDNFVNKFGLSSKKLALNLLDYRQHYRVEQEISSVKDIAQQYIGYKFKTTTDVVQAAQSMAAIQISKEPIIKFRTREVFFEKATITVELSKRGDAIIDKEHGCYSMKRFKNKPVKELTGDQFFKLDLAQKDNLLTVTINGNCDSFMDLVKKFHVRPERNKNVQDWNVLRVTCVEIAFQKYIIPDLKTELRDILYQEAKESILKSCRKKMYHHIKVAPYQVKFSEWNASKGLRVMAIAYGLDKTASPFICVVTPDGNVANYLKFSELFTRKDIIVQAKLKDVIRKEKPHLVVIGGESKEALMILRYTKQAISELMESRQFPPIEVEIIDNELAKVYANSKIGMNDFRAYPELLRQAISLARKMQDPLIEYAQLFNTYEDILSLEFHSLQKKIPPEELLRNLLLEFVNRTNEVGVDINRVIKDSRTSNLVQFVGGFGPRKAQHLLEVLKQMGTQIEDRHQLVSECHLGPNAYVNCSGFFKIDTDSLSDCDERGVNPLHGSRVHSESYDLAFKMAMDALDSKYTNRNDALREILKTPEKLDRLNLDVYVVEEELEKWGYKYTITVYDIKAELCSRYKDLRSPYVSPDSFELFCILNKLPPNTLSRGGFIEGEVSQILFLKPNQQQIKTANPIRNKRSNVFPCPHIEMTCRRGKATWVKLRLDYGIPGFIHLSNLKDFYIKNIEEHVSIGEVLDCRIIGIDLDKFHVLCTSKVSDLENRNPNWRPNKNDPYYESVKKYKGKRETGNNDKRVHRDIEHPAFRNISFNEAETYLASKLDGDVVIIPSSKGSDYLTFIWKVADNVYQDIDVKEEGTKLRINDKTFEHLNEIITNHINPMASFCLELLTHSFYKNTNGGMKDKMEELVKEMEAKDSSKIHYFITASKNYPGKFLFSYLPRDKYKHEYITITPEGVKFRNKFFDTVGNLFNWFKPNPIHSANSLHSINNQQIAQNLSGATGKLSTITNQTSHYFSTSGNISSVRAPSMSYGKPSTSNYGKTPETLKMTPRSGRSLESSSSYNSRSHSNN